VSPRDNNILARDRFVEDDSQDMLLNRPSSAGIRLRPLSATTSPRFFSASKSSILQPLARFSLNLTSPGNHKELYNGKSADDSFLIPNSSTNIDHSSYANNSSVSPLLVLPGSAPINNIVRSADDKSLLFQTLIKIDWMYPQLSVSDRAKKKIRVWLLWVYPRYRLVQRMNSRKMVGQLLQDCVLERVWSEVGRPMKKTFETVFEKPTPISVLPARSNDEIVYSRPQSQRELPTVDGDDYICPSVMATAESPLSINSPATSTPSEESSVISVHPHSAEPCKPRTDSMFSDLSSNDRARDTVLYFNEADECAEIQPENTEEIEGTTQPKESNKGTTAQAATKIALFIVRCTVKRRNRRYRNLLRMAVRIQRRWRGTRARLELLRDVRAGVLLNSLWRKHQAYRMLKSQLRRVDRPYTIILHSLNNISFKVLSSNSGVMGQQTLKVKISVWWHPLLHIVGKNDYDAVLQAKQPQLIFTTQPAKVLWEPLQPVAATPVPETSSKQSHAESSSPTVPISIATDNQPQLQQVQQHVRGGLSQLWRLHSSRGGGGGTSDPAQLQQNAANALFLQQQKTKMCIFEDAVVQIPGCHGNSVVKFEIFDGERKIGFSVFYFGREGELMFWGGRNFTRPVTLTLQQRRAVVFGSSGGSGRDVGRATLVRHNLPQSQTQSTPSSAQNDSQQIKQQQAAMRATQAAQQMPILRFSVVAGAPLGSRCQWCRMVLRHKGVSAMVSQQQQPQQQHHQQNYSQSHQRSTHSPHSSYFEDNYHIDHPCDFPHSRSSSPTGNRKSSETNLTLQVPPLDQLQEHHNYQHQYQHNHTFVQSTITASHMSSMLGTRSSSVAPLFGLGTTNASANVAAPICASSNRNGMFSMFRGFSSLSGSYSASYSSSWWFSERVLRVYLSLDGYYALHCFAHKFDTKPLFSVKISDCTHVSVDIAGPNSLNHNSNNANSNSNSSFLLNSLSGLSTSSHRGVSGGGSSAVIAEDICNVILHTVQGDEIYMRFADSASTASWREALQHAIFLQSRTHHGNTSPPPSPQTRLNQSFLTLVNSYQSSLSSHQKYFNNNNSSHEDDVRIKELGTTNDNEISATIHPGNNSLHSISEA
jgi:hypothetical protein